uniref:39S ribosomal protein L28, mitochondrial n=2 Tax=Onchocerca TaxID=6281 RepID=A0A8R1TJC1_ONCVO
MTSACLIKNLKAVANIPPLPAITWDRAERIRRNKEIWDNKNSIVHRLPYHYKKRYWEFVLSEAKPVHYRKPTSRYEWDAKRHMMVETEDYPILGFHPPEADKGLWGGEMVVKGYIQSRPFTKKKILPRQWVPHFFFPHLKSVVAYSEVLDKHMKITMTERTCRLIDQHFGLDLYLLETPEIDIASKLGNKLKREILLVLAKGTYYPNDPERHNYIKQKYAKFLISIEEADWFGLDLNEACRKQQEIEESVKPTPEKYKLELDLVKRLASGEENPDHDKIIKELESESVVGKKVRKVMQMATQRLKKMVN